MQYMDAQDLMDSNTWLATNHVRIVVKHGGPLVATFSPTQYLEMGFIGFMVTMLHIFKRTLDIIPITLV